MDFKILPITTFNAAPRFTFLLDVTASVPVKPPEKPVPSAPRARPMSKAERIAKSKETLCKQGLIACVLAKGALGGLWSWATTP